MCARARVGVVGRASARAPPRYRRSIPDSETPSRDDKPAAAAGEGFPDSGPQAAGILFQTPNASLHASLGVLSEAFRTCA